MALTYRDILDGILNAKTLESLKKAVNVYIFAVSCEDDGEDVFVELLMDELEKKTNSPMHQMLYAFLEEPITNREIENALLEFFVMCDEFKRAKKHETSQITVEEFYEVLNELEEKRGIRSILEKEHKLIVFETNMRTWFHMGRIIYIKDKIFVPLPRIQNDIDKKQYICRMIGMSLIELCNIKCSFKHMVLLLYGFIPEFKNISELMLNLFEERLYESVLSSKEQNSKIENDFKLQRYDFIHNLKSKINNKRKSIIFN